jgi:hypothetical protein
MAAPNSKVMSAEDVMSLGVAVALLICEIVKHHRRFVTRNAPCTCRNKQ